MLWRLEILWTWEKESRGQKPKSLKKVSKSPAPLKSEKNLEKGPKSPPQNPFSDFSDLFQDFFRTFGARLFEIFFRDVF